MTLRLLGVIAFALIAGGGSAYWIAQKGFELGGVADGPWQTNANIGSAAAGPYLRAGIAVAGLLALNKSETVYYTATRDSEGQPLRSNCIYAVEGGDPPARWWSITAYGADHFLIPNERKAYAVAKTNVARDADGRFRITAGGPAQGVNWLSVGEAAAAQPFSLTLRLYNPEASVVANLAGVELPRIRKQGCQ